MTSERKLLDRNTIVGLEPKKACFYLWDKKPEKGLGLLGVKVYPSKSKYFVFRYYQNKKRVFIQLGRFPQLSLVDAREMAKEFGQLLKQGIDPKESLKSIALEREKAKTKHAELGTVEQLFHAYTNQMKKDGKRTYEKVCNGQLNLETALGTF